MRILLDTYDFAMHRMGGGEYVMLSLKQYLEERNCQVDFYNPWIHDPKKYNIYHYFSCRQWQYWPLFRKQYPSIPFVLTPTIAISQNKKNIIQKIAGLSMEHRYRQALKPPSHILPATVFEARYIQNTLEIAPEKITVLPNGISDWVTKGDKKIFYEKIGYVPQEKIFLSVGRFETTKNQKTLIQAFQKIPNFLCVFIGSGDFSSNQYLLECRKLAEKYSGGNRKFLFFPGVAQKDPFLAAAYAAADVYVQPSLYETFAMAALEAYAAGASLLLTDKVAEKNIFSESNAVNGAINFFQPENIKSIENALLASLNWQRRDKPREEIVQKFHWRGIAENLLEIYKGL